MLPVALAMSLLVLPPDEIELRPSMWVKVRERTSVELLAEKLRGEAVELRNAKNPADALPLFNVAAMLHPDNTDIRIGRAKTFAALGRYDEQADEYAWVIARNPTDCDAWQAVGEGWMARGKWDEAAKCFDHAAELTAPGRYHCEAHLRSALIWLGKEEAIDDEAELNPKDLANLPLPRLIQAEQALSNALREDSDAYRYLRSDILFIRGVTRHALNRRTEATKDYDEVLEINAACVPAHILCGQLAFDTNDYPRAMTHIEAAERNGGDLALVAQMRCKTLVGMGDYERAEVAAGNWNRLDPSDKEAGLYHAITLRMCGKDDEADQVSELAAELHQQTVFERTYSEVCVLWAWYSRYEDADRLLTRMLTRVLTVPERAAVYFNRGHLRRQLRTNEVGFDDLTAAVRLCPAYPEARKQRAEVALLLKRNSDALEDAEALTRLTPWDPAAHKLLADARGAINMTAAIAGREPDYRPTGPLLAIPRSYCFGAALAEAYLPKR